LLSRRVLAGRESVVEGAETVGWRRMMDGRMDEDGEDGRNVVR
jgi:hypothetical protein